MGEERGQIGRREFVGGGGALLVAGCVSCPDPLAEPWTPGAGELGDVHAHFFNMSDLPIRGFVTHVLVPNRAPQYASLAEALGHLFDWLKGWAPTIREERRGLYLPLGGIPERHVSLRRYAEAAAEKINRESAGAAPSPSLVADFSRPAPTRAESYRDLALVLNGARHGSQGVVPPQAHVTADRMEGVVAGRWRAETRFAVEDPQDSCAVEPASCVEESCDEPPSSLSMQWEQIMTLFGWIGDMMEGRCRHVHHYLDCTRGGAWHPKLIVNHLVDYDAWLGDQPADGSSHDQQIEFWSDLSLRIREQADVEIVTFAGYDPLKHAEQRLRNEPSFFDRAQTYYQEGKIGGFKVYPPMGFKPSGNHRHDYRGETRARGIVGENWRKPPLAGHDIGEKINEALFAFYDFCVREDAPVLAHAIRGNQAACCFGQRANPAHWADLFEREPRYRRLRLCLGHLVSEAKCFADSVLAGGPGPAHVWALHGIARLLRMSAQGQANVYVDIGYLSEILKSDQSDSERFATRFFTALKAYCLRYDPCCERILFGTDWIVIGWELGYRRYVDLILQGMREAQWDQRWQENLLHNNLQRFLGRMPHGACQAAAP